MFSDAQKAALILYVREQAEHGLGAAKKMVFAAIAYLKDQKTPAKPPPSWRWFQKWLKASQALHAIKTKPINKQRIDVHKEEDVKKWFEEKLRPVLK